MIHMNSKISPTKERWDFFPCLFHQIWTVEVSLSSFTCKQYFLTAGFNFIRVKKTQGMIDNRPE